jgi:hypothetical protein
MKPIISMIMLLALGLFINGCDDPVEEAVAPQTNLDLINFLSALPSDESVSNGRALPRPLSWGDCEKFAGVVTNAVFDPANGNFDELYAGANFKDGVGLISESKPGDQDYNGGRWHLNLLKEGVDPNKYMNACSVEDLDLNDFESTTNYFECPMLPRRGKNG